MTRTDLIGSMLCASLSAAGLFAQAPAKVDFRRDVQPIFKTNCIGCHGPKLQMSNFRLDRRRDAMRGGTMTMITPGYSQGSHLYRKLMGTGFGQQMPPTGALPPEQIEIIKAWIDQGADWPIDVSGDAPLTPPDPKMTRMVAALRSGDLPGFKKILRADPQLVNAKATGGATPLMYATLYGNADSVRLVLKMGGDPNLRNDSGATTLMCAIP